MKIFKASGLKSHIILTGVAIRLMPELTETVGARKQWNDIFKFMKENNY